MRSSFVIPIRTFVLVIFVALHLVRSDYPHHETELQNQFSVDLHPSCFYAVRDYSILIDAMERGLMFLDEYAENVYTDAAVGARVVEAQLGAILRSHRDLPSEIKSHFTHLKNEAARIAEKVLWNLESSGFLTPNQWIFQSEWVKSAENWKWPLSGDHWEDYEIMKSYEPSEGINISSFRFGDEVLYEDVSDQCMYEILKCEKYSLSDECKRSFLDAPNSLYSLTHQAIYSMFAVKHECYEIQGAKEWRNWQEQLCGKIWLQANAIDLIGFPSVLRDLFVEQVMICGMIGYPNFFKQDWLHQILSWQSPKLLGCFLDERPNENRVKIWHELFQMKGRNEVCNVHFTALGIGALSLHLRYFFHTCLV